MNTQSTRASAGYHLTGVAHHDSLQALRLHARYEPAHYGGLRLASAVLLMGAYVVGFLAAVEVVKATGRF